MVRRVHRYVRHAGIGHRRFSRVVLPLLLCWAAAAPAQIYKWIDENGNIQFGDKPPAEGAEEIQVRGAGAPDPEIEKHREKRRRLLEVMEEEREETEQSKRQAEEQEARRRTNCELASKQLNEMRAANFLYEETGDPDNPRILSDAERAAATADAEREKRRWCQ